VINGFISKTLREELARQAPELAFRFSAMEERALRDWIPLLIPDKGSHSGLVHLINVGRNVDKMLPPDKQRELNAGEIFLLLTAVLLHDIGRIIQEEKEHPPCSKVVCELNESDRPCLKAQRDHYMYSESLIRNNANFLGLPDDMTAACCGLLAYCHGLSIPPRERQKRYPKAQDCVEFLPERHSFRNTSIEPLGSIRIPLLAAILRIADEAENHWTRAIDDRWLKAMLQYAGNVQTDGQPKSDISKEADLDRYHLGKAFRRKVQDVEFCHAGQCIILHLAEKPEGPDSEKHFANIADEIEAILTSTSDNRRSWGHELRPLNISFKHVYLEIDGQLWRFIEQKTLTNDPEKVLEGQNWVTFEGLKKALVRLSKTTMGYEDFSRAAVEAEVGRPLRDLDWWLIERMEDWWPKVISVDHQRERVHILRDKAEKLLSNPGQAGAN